jgi:restriction system protein
MKGRWFQRPFLFLGRNELAIPDYETLMAPLLRLLGSKGLMSLGEAVTHLADEFQLTPEERAVLLPSGQYPLFRNRVGWAKTYLKQAGLIAQPKRGLMELSPSARALLPELPVHIDGKFLARYPSFLEFMSRSGPKQVAKPGEDKVLSVVPVQAALDVEGPPEEVIERAMRTLRDELRIELLDTVKAVAPEFFERLVVRLLLTMGYGGSREEAGQMVGRSGDGGIDGLINEDRLGLDAIYLQAKRWEGLVGRPEIMKFVGALAGQRANKGVFITTSWFTQEAKDYASTSQYKVVLIDGARLADLMIEHDLGVSVAATYQLKRIDSDFFADE